MKKEVFEKAKKINDSINDIKKKKERIELIRLCSQSPNANVTFGFQGINFISLNNDEIEYISHFLMIDCDNKIKGLEKELETL